MTAAVRAARSDVRLAAWLGFVLLFAVANYAARLAADDPIEPDLLYEWGFFAAALVQLALMLSITLALARRGPARELLALRSPPNWRRAAGYMAAILAGVLALGVLADWALDAGDEQGLVPEEWDGSRAAPFAANFVVAAALVPIAEELLFRGVGFTLLRRFGPALAVVAVGILFALAHGLVRAFLPLFVFGVGMALLRDRTKSIVPGIVVHGAFNVLGMSLAAAFGDRAEDALAWLVLVPA